MGPTQPCRLFYLFDYYAPIRYSFKYRTQAPGAPLVKGQGPERGRRGWGMVSGFFFSIIVSHVAEGRRPTALFKLLSCELFFHFHREKKD
jgi:hypothetical protein